MKHASTKAMTSVYTSGKLSHLPTASPDFRIISKVKVTNQKPFSLYAPPIRPFDMPSNNPFYNGTMLTEAGLFEGDINDLKGGTTNVILKRHLDFSLMSKKQQIKIKNLL